jgi:hypothetical protein
MGAKEHQATRASIRADSFSEKPVNCLGISTLRIKKTSLGAVFLADRAFGFVAHRTDGFLLQNWIGQKWNIAPQARRSTRWTAM